MIAVGPFELNKHSQQDAHAAILAFDRSRVLKVCVQLLFVQLDLLSNKKIDSNLLSCQYLFLYDKTTDICVDALGSIEQQ
jgi:hypothetical protein